MKANLEMIHHIIEDTDAVGEKSLFFYNNPAARQKFITEILQFSVFKIQDTENPIEIQQKASEILTWLDKNFQEYAWPAHEVHFHTNFMQHCGCPFTCLNEISNIIEKLMNNKFAS